MDKSQCSLEVIVSSSFSLTMSVTGVISLNRFVRSSVKAVLAVCPVLISVALPLQGQSVTPEWTSTELLAVSGNTGVALDNAGNVYIAETNNSVVVELSYSGGAWSQTHAWGTAGQPGTDSSHLNAPTSLAVSGDGH